MSADVSKKLPFICRLSALPFCDVKVAVALLPITAAPSVQSEFEIECSAADSWMPFSHSSDR